MKLARSVAVLLAILASPAQAGLFSSCEGSPEPMPEWASRPDYRVPGYYVGVGSAEQADRSQDEQLKAADDNAKANLVQSIEVTIRSENEQNTRVTGQGVELDAQSKVVVSAEEVLRDLQVKARWMDDDSCRLYTLMVIGESSVAKARREKIMKNRVAAFKVSFAQATDRKAHPDINVRRKYLEESQSLLRETDFALLPEEVSKAVYEQRLVDAIAQWRTESSQSKGRTAMFVINKVAGMRADVIGKMMDTLRSRDNNADRLMAECGNADECIARARERGFSMLALMQTTSELSTSQMGAIKGTLSIVRTVYDIESHRIIKGPEKVTGQVIGWSDEELDWAVAAEKAVDALQM